MTSLQNNKRSALPILPGYNSAAAPSYPAMKSQQPFLQAGGPATAPPMALNQQGMNQQFSQPMGMNSQPGIGQPMGSYPQPNSQLGMMNPQMNQPMGQPMGNYAQPGMNSQMGQAPVGMQQQYGYPQSMPNQYGSQPGMMPQPGMNPAVMSGMNQPPLFNQQGVNMGYGGGTVSLQKGGNMSLSKAAPGLTQAYVGLGWDVRQSPGAPFDLDASCFLLNAAGKIRQPQDFIFYNNLRSVDGSIIHQGDNLTGVGSGDDERILVNLALIPADVQRIVFVVSIYEALQRNQNFGMVQNAFIRVVNADNQVEIVRFDLSEEASLLNALLFGELYRYNNEWKFRALGQGVQGGLQQVGAMFGMSLA